MDKERNNDPVENTGNVKNTNVKGNFIKRVYFMRDELCKEIVGNISAPELKKLVSSNSKDLYDEVLKKAVKGSDKELEKLSTVMELIYYIESLKFVPEKTKVFKLVNSDSELALSYESIISEYLKNVTKTSSFYRVTIALFRKTQTKNQKDDKDFIDVLKYIQFLVASLAGKLESQFALEKTEGQDDSDNSILKAIEDCKIEQALQKIVSVTEAVDISRFFVKGVYEMLPKAEKNDGISIEDCANELFYLSCFISGIVKKEVKSLDQNKLAHICYILESQDSSACDKKYIAEVAKGKIGIQNLIEVAISNKLK
jgi:hypothetical protein